MTLLSTVNDQKMKWWRENDERWWPILMKRNNVINRKMKIIKVAENEENIKWEKLKVTQVMW